MQTSSMQYFLGASSDENLTTVLARLCSLPAWRPFDDRVVSFVGKLSQKILVHPNVRNYPELAALGHWFRKSRLIDLARSSNAAVNGKIQIGRGLAFHLAPSNVDSVFMYSWLLSLLAGNANLVRVSQKGGAQQDFLIEVLKELSLLPEYSEVAQRFVLLTYPHDDGLTKQISENCFVRVIWGGDATVRSIRAIPLRPMATELCFADRFSVAALSASAVLAADELQLKKLVQGFYIDTYWFAQQACSSPRMVVWVGDKKEIDECNDKFWSAFSKEVELRADENSPAMVMARLGASFEYAALGLAGLSIMSQLGDSPSRLDLVTADLDGIREIHCGNGLFVQMSFNELWELGAHLTDKEQTLAVYGFEQEDYLKLVTELPARALDRIVPIGESLAFDIVWDGQDLITSFTRIVTWPQTH